MRRFEGVVQPEAQQALGQVPALDGPVHGDAERRPQRRRRAPRKQANVATIKQLQRRGVRPHNVKLKVPHQECRRRRRRRRRVRHCLARPASAQGPGTRFVGGGGDAARFVDKAQGALPAYVLQNVKHAAAGPSRHERQASGDRHGDRVTFASAFKHEMHLLRSAVPAVVQQKFDGRERAQEGRRVGGDGRQRSGERDEAANGHETAVLLW